ncbi:hypothetical protein SteCoe_36175 [Stentor coeruleus]|uniref:Uncharacterized protein n=1 Tax=Stentor coeruleus TaxID=5963 RepID=A0A1R2AQX3_9CILI|nr:hypothetical protein SteCoe_36175 [Stentor coeruleus]
MGAAGSKKSKRDNEEISVNNIDNLLLDRIGEAQIGMLLEKFKKYEIKGGLDVSGFKKLMPYITSLPSGVIENAFAQFASKETGKITWEGFCSEVSKSMLGSREEKCRFLFKVFNKSKNEFLSKKDAAQLKSHLINISSDKKPTETTLVDLITLYSESNTLAYNNFKTWALNNVDLHKALQPFEIIPSPNSEKEYFTKEIKNFTQTGLVSGETYYLISSIWLNAWKSYVSYDKNAISILVSYKPNFRPDSITNADLLDLKFPDKLLPGLKEPDDFTVIPKKVWQNFIKWYGGGPKIPRQAIQIQNKTELEIYPPLFLIYYHKNKQAALSSKPIQTFISSCKLVHSIIDIVKNEIYDYDELYVFIKNQDKFELLNNDTRIRDLDLQDVNICTVGFMPNSKDSEIHVEITGEVLDFKEGDAVEYKDMGKWIQGVVKSNTDGSLNLLLMNGQYYVKVDKTEISRVRRQKRTLLSNKSVYLFCGITNIGNTCYMNAVMQVLFHTKLIFEYFSSAGLIKDVERLKGYGQLVVEMAGMFGNVKYPGRIRMVPTKFFKEFLKMNTEFVEGVQNDTYEFLQKLLINLHEALSKNCQSMEKTIVVNELSLSKEIKTAKDQWENYRGLKGSIISAVFGTQTKNTFTCTNCHATKSIFEVFNDYSIPIPPSSEGSIILLTIVTRNCTYLKQLSIKIRENMHIDDFIAQVDNKSPIKFKNLVFSHIYRGYCNEYFIPFNIEDLFSKKNSKLYAFEVITSIVDIENIGRFVSKHKKVINWRENLQENELVDYFYNNQWVLAHVKKLEDDDLNIVLHVKEDVNQQIKRTDPNLEFYRMKTVSEKIIFLFPISHLRMNKKNKAGFFGTPYMLSIGSWYTWYDLINELKRICLLFFDRSGDIENVVTFFLYNIDKGPCGLCDGNCIGCKIPNNYETLEKLAPNHEKLNIRVFWYNYKSYKTLPIATFPEEDIFTLQDCLNKFTEKEIIENKCEQCSNPHQESCIEILRLPDILILHLKRMRFVSSQLTKINSLVKFPLENLDMKGFMKNSKKSMGNTVKNTKNNYLYDLFAVVEHEGDLYSGHNTAYCKQPNGEWLHFNDDRVFLLNGNIEQEIITSRAYILFYKRQRFRSANIVKTMQG